MYQFFRVEELAVQGPHGRCGGCLFVECDEGLTPASIVLLRDDVDPELSALQYGSEPLPRAYQLTLVHMA